MRRRLLVVWVLAGVVIGIPGAASGQSLAVTSPTVGNFGGLDLNGNAQDVTAPIGNFQVSDTRATGTGWHLTVSAARFAEWDPALDFGRGDYVPGGRRLPQGSLRMLKPSVSGNLNPAPQPTDLLGQPIVVMDAPPVIRDGPYFIDGATVQVASAAPLTGVGTYEFTQNGPLRLSVPASAYAARYRSEITLSVADGP